MEYIFTKYVQVIDIFICNIGNCNFIENDEKIHGQWVNYYVFKNDKNVFTNYRI